MLYAGESERSGATVYGRGGVKRENEVVADTKYYKRKHYPYKSKPLDLPTSL